MNEYSPMVMTELGMFTVVKPVQLWNEEKPIEMTELGMFTAVKLSQP